MGQAREKQKWGNVYTQQTHRSKWLDLRYTVDADCKGFPHRCQALLQCVQDNQLGEVEVLLSSFPEYPLERGGEGTGQVTDTKDTVIWQTPLPALSMHPKLELTEF
jgi:hypothetical protein